MALLQGAACRKWPSEVPQGAVGGLRLGPSASGDPEVLGLPLQLAVGGSPFHHHTSPTFSQENFPRLWQNEKNKDKPVSFSRKLIFFPHKVLFYFF